MGLDKAIQIYRSRLGLTQKQLAQNAGLAEITVRKYESGERYPKNKQLKQLAEALHVSIKDLHDLEFCIDNNITPEDLKQRDIEIEKSGILLEIFEQLNNKGQDTAIEHITMLSKVPDFQKIKEDKHKK